MTEVELVLDARQSWEEAAWSVERRPVLVDITGQKVHVYSLPTGRTGPSRWVRRLHAGAAPRRSGAGYEWDFLWMNPAAAWSNLHSRKPPAQ
jgi:hypothetical protein